jgi:hypothetical protein
MQQETNYKEIGFDEIAHRYFNEVGETYISCTQIIERYKKKYDREFWCMYTGLKDNHILSKPFPEERKIGIRGRKYTIKQLRKDAIYRHYYEMTDAKWKALNAEACFRGNQKHDYLEDSINLSKGDSDGTTNIHIRPQGYKKPLETQHDLDQTDLKEKHPFIYNRLLGYIQRGCSIYAEKRLHLDDYKVAGMIDVPIIKGRKFCILDWKTNKDELKKEAGYYKKRKIGDKWVKTDMFIDTGETFLYPLSHLAASKFNLYALQLSLYAYMMEAFGYELANNGLEIIHMRPGYDDKLIKIPYLKNEIQLMLNHYASVA